MRAIFGVLGLLIALVVAGVLAKKQLSALSAAPTGRQQKPALANQSVNLPAATLDATPQRQSQLIQQQIKQSVEAAMQQARPVPEDVP
jgi:TfoX/Sxy family transcriptional regulator of competence genes